jgi:hypothetical protein
MADNVDKDDDKDAGGAAEAAPAKKDKPAAKGSGEAKAASPAKAKTGAKKSTDDGKKQPSADKSGARRAPPPTTASLSKSITLFVVVVGVLAVGFALLGQERGSGSARGPSWKVGQTVDLEVTLVASDKKELSCASSEEIAGRHCAFEAASKPWSKDPTQDDKKTFRPYTSTDNVQFLGAGLWSEPALAGTLPASRFTVKCKYTVEGKLKSPTFHWESGWEGQPRGEMFAGLFTGCTIIP